MTLRSRLLSYFPLLWLMLVGVAVMRAVLDPTVLTALALPVAVYLLPLGCYRLHEVHAPLVERPSHLSGSDYNPWWGGHQLQLPFIAFPALEMPLKLVPGAYSLWLRCWGSRIGRRVYWTPWVEVVDRGLLDVGDDVVFGHRVGIYGHLIKRTHTNVLLVAKRVTVGNGAFVGAGTVLLPGAVIEENAVVPMSTEVRVNERYPAATEVTA